MLHCRRRAGAPREGESLEIQRLINEQFEIDVELSENILEVAEKIRK